jgi:hypothetical protein
MVPTERNFPQNRQTFGDRLWRDFPPIDANTLPEVHQMGRGVKAGPEAGGPQHCIQHRADGTLPVGAGHMEKAQTLSGFPWP